MPLLLYIGKHSETISFSKFQIVIFICDERRVFFLQFLFQIFRGLMAACASGFSLFASIVLRPDNYEVIRLLALPMPHRVDYLKEPHAYCNMISTFLCLALSQYQ